MPSLPFSFDGIADRDGVVHVTRNVPVGPLRIKITKFELRTNAGAIEEQELIDFCRANMAHFKTPRKVAFGPLPKTSTGKIRKFELRERARRL